MRADQCKGKEKQLRAALTQTTARLEGHFANAFAAGSWPRWRAWRVRFASSTCLGVGRGRPAWAAAWRGARRPGEKRARCWPSMRRPVVRRSEQRTTEQGLRAQPTRTSEKRSKSRYHGPDLGGWCKHDRNSLGR